MTEFQPRTANYAARVAESFAKQSFMALLDAKLVRVAAGAVDIEVRARGDLTQQHGFFHAGVTAAIADSAAGYAAFSLFDDDAGVLTTEFKINLLNPAVGERMVARGRVIRPGRTLTICRSDVTCYHASREVHVATALLTMMSLGDMEPSRARSVDE